MNIGMCSGIDEARKDEALIEVGQLRKVTTESFFTSGEKHKIKRPVKIKRGEIIEIRYPYEWHFRTIDDEYFHASSDMIIRNSELCGTIWENVRAGNNCKLEDILRMKLFKPTMSYSEVLKDTPLELKGLGTTDETIS